MLEARAALAQCSPSAILDAGASSFRNSRDLLPSRAFRENVKPTRHAPRHRDPFFPSLSLSLFFSFSQNQRNSDRPTKRPVRRDRLSLVFFFLFSPRRSSRTHIVAIFDACRAAQTDIRKIHRRDRPEDGLREAARCRLIDEMCYSDVTGEL